MKLSELKQKGGIVDASLVKKSVEWTHLDEAGKVVTDSFDVFVRRLGYGVMERAMRPDPNDPERSLTAALISEAILLGEQADEPISYRDAFQLQPSLAKVLAVAIREVNEPSKEKK